jgi:two-component system, LytTR family, response regulator LytT
MKIVLIEDEQFTAEDLAGILLRLDPAIRITAILRSVKEAMAFFKGDEQADLIFSDIELGDGLSFEIFSAIAVTAPVIFCTAYDEYALNAFKANGIDYILKPFGEKTIADALRKYERLRENFVAGKSVSALTEMVAQHKTRQTTSVLVFSKDKIVPVQFSDVALFYIRNEITYLVTFGQKIYPVQKTLEELEKAAGPGFYRANRQYLVNRSAVKEASQYFGRKLSLSLLLPFDEKITVSKEKATGFLNWLTWS